MVEDPVLSAIDKEIAGLEAQLTGANSSHYAPERMVVRDGDPEADAKVAAMQAKYPGKTVIVRTIVGSRMRHAPIPEVEECAGTPLPTARIDGDVIERARDRLAKLRGDA